MPKPTTPVETLLAELHHADFTTRSNAARQLGQTRDPRAVDALLHDLHDADWRVRRNAAQALGVARDRRAVEPLIAALQDRSVTVQQRAAVALGRLRDPRALPALVEIVRSGRGPLLESVTHALRKFGAAAIPALLTALDTMGEDRTIDDQQVDHRRLRVKMTELLAATKHDDALEPIIAALDDRDMHVRCHAACALGQLGNRRAVAPLIAALERADLPLREAIARALGQLGDERAVAPLLQLLPAHDIDGPDEHVYRAVTSALQAISHIPASFSGIVNNDLGVLISVLNTEHIEQLAGMAATMQQGLAQLAPTIMPADRAARMMESLAGTFAVHRRYQDGRSRAAAEVMTLIEWLTSDSALTRIGAAVSLPWYMDPSALEPLRASTNDDDPGVRQAATWASRRLAATLGYRQQLGFH